MTLRYNDYRVIQARFDSKGTCGHDIKKGDVIGIAYKRGTKESDTRCKECWDRWSYEVAADNYGGVY